MNVHSYVDWIRVMVRIKRKDEIVKEVGKRDEGEPKNSNSVNAFVIIMQRKQGKTT